MQDKLDIHGYRAKIANIDNTLKDLSKSNKDLILKFKAHLF